ncbi:MAG TPA: hypothetical protein VKE74_31960 [Gemmataceae bacterium]|nr:hypothetical protein [Gemmataceae bacterium]
MPKTVPCPTCRTAVKLPRDAEPGTELTCPDCAEVFVPKHLKKKAHEPEDEETYEVGAVTGKDDPEQTAKKRRAKVLMRQGRQMERDRRQPVRKPFFGGFEVILLVVAAATALAAVLGCLVVKRAPSTGEAILIVVVYCGLMLIFGWRKLIGARERLGG